MNIVSFEVYEVDMSRYSLGEIIVTNGEGNSVTLHIDWLDWDHYSDNPPIFKGDVLSLYYDESAQIIRVGLPEEEAFLVGVDAFLEAFIDAPHVQDEDTFFSLLERMCRLPRSRKNLLRTDIELLFQLKGVQNAPAIVRSVFFRALSKESHLLGFPVGIEALKILACGQKLLFSCQGSIGERDAFLKLTAFYKLLIARLQIYYDKKEEPLPSWAKEVIRGNSARFNMLSSAERFWMKETHQLYRSFYQYAIDDSPEELALRHTGNAGRQIRTVEKLLSLWSVLDEKQRIAHKPELTAVFKALLQILTSELEDNQTDPTYMMSLQSVQDWVETEV